MAKLTVTGGPELAARLHALGVNAPALAAQALYQTGSVMMADAKEHYVPVATGTLRRSGYVAVPVVEGTKVAVEVGFHAPYALQTHENPRAGKTGGHSPSGQSYTVFARRGEWKYLETPLKAHSPELAVALRKAIDDYAADLAYQTGSVNVRPLPRAPRPTGNDILEGP